MICEGMATHTFAVLRAGSGQRLPSVVSNHLLLNGVVVHSSSLVSDSDVTETGGAWLVWGRQ